MAAVALGYFVRDIRLGLLAGALIFHLAAFRLWDSAMVTLASSAIAVPMGLAGGMTRPIAAWRWCRMERTLKPMPNQRQSIPTFAFLVPIIMLSGIDLVPVFGSTWFMAHPQWYA
jgi:glycine betaine/proline transport system permease protein